MRFQGSPTYVATDDLKLAVNAALALERPLLIKGEPGTGKTLLAETVANALGRPLHQWHIKSTTKAQQGLYEYDAVSRLRDSQLGDGRVGDIGNYIKRGVLWEAFESEAPAVVLIDEIDKADIEFPNDLLRELDRMEFYVYETRQTIVARHRPLVVITSNNEKELPDAFLRRCFFHYIKFPDRDATPRPMASCGTFGTRRFLRPTRPAHGSTSRSTCASAWVRCRSSCATTLTVTSSGRRVTSTSMPTITGWRSATRGTRNARSARRSTPNAS